MFLRVKVSFSHYLNAPSQGSPVIRDLLFSKT
jgi:hypothetical protein